VKNKDISMGQYRWLTVSSPEGAEGVELLLEPMGFAPAQTYQKALFAAGIPATVFFTKDIGAEFRRLKDLGSISAANQRPWDRSPESCSKTPAAT
jgi:hypothetical protein